MPTTQALTASETNNAARGRPVMIGRNALELSSSRHWSALGGDFGSASLGWSTAPPEVTHDRAGDPASMPNPAGASIAELVLAWELPANTRVVDAVGIVGTNLAQAAADLSDTILVDLDTADADDFTTGLTQVATWSVTAAGPTRLGALFSAAYVGQRWWRLTFTRDSAANWPSLALGIGLPSIGEVYLGKRRQMPFTPQRPYDALSRVAEEEVMSLPGGTLVGVTVTAPRGVWDLRWRLRQDEWGVEARDVLRAWYADSHGRASIWMPDSTAPNVVHLARARERAMHAPEVSLQLQEASIALVELPPFRGLEVDVVGV